MKNKKKIYILIISIILLVMSPSIFAFSKKEIQEEDKVEQVVAKYNRIDAKTAKEAFDTQSDIYIIDVRTPEEFNSGHVINSINIPLDIIVRTTLEKYPNKEEKLYLYCRSGNRSSQAAKLLVKQGYTNVYDFGGIISWPYEVTK
jgi:rhodanese-related sulfurtransferase